MKRYIIIISSIVLIQSCAPKEYPLQGKNYGKISVIKSPKPIDSVWSNIIDLFATKGISIKVIDKNSGLIVSDRYNFNKKYSFEIDGRLMDTTAWIALSYTAVKGGFQENQIKVSADWNIRVKADVNGSIINVNLTNIDATAHVPPRGIGSYSQNAMWEDYTFDGESTGVFERLIQNSIK